MLASSSRRRRPTSCRVHAQASRACKDRDRRFLFRAWNRLCLHAASRNAAEVQSAKDTPVAKTATSAAGVNEAAAVATADNVPLGTAALQEGAEMAVRGAREQRQRCAVQQVRSLPDVHRRRGLLIGKRAAAIVRPMVDFRRPAFFFALILTV